MADTSGTTPEKEKVITLDDVLRADLWYTLPARASDQVANGAAIVQLTVARQVDDLLDGGSYDRSDVGYSDIRTYFQTASHVLSRDMAVSGKTLIAMRSAAKAALKTEAVARDSKAARVVKLTDAMLLDVISRKFVRGATEKAARDLILV